MNAGREVGMDRGISVCGEESFLISDFSLPLSREVSSHFMSHSQKHAGSGVCLSERMPSLDFIFGKVRCQTNICMLIKKIFIRLWLQ